MRKTPCVEGCWGPRLTITWSVLRLEFGRDFDPAQPGVEGSIALGHPSFRVEASRVIYILAEGVRILGTQDMSFWPAAFEGLAFIFIIRLAPVLAQRMPLEAFPHQDATQIRMPFETDAQQIPCFPFLQLCAREDRHKRGYAGFLTRHLNFEHQG